MSLHRLESLGPNRKSGKRWRVCPFCGRTYRFDRGCQCRDTSGRSLGPALLAACIIVALVASWLAYGPQS